MNKSGVLILYFIFIPTNILCHSYRSHYVYEFGKDKGNIIYRSEGNIGHLTPVTEKDIPIFSDFDVTYVRVTVDSISPPKVDYSSSVHRVSIVFSWLQISSSSYSITVKGVRRSKKATRKHKFRVQQENIRSERSQQMNAPAEPQPATAGPASRLETAPHMSSKTT